MNGSPRHPFVTPTGGWNGTSSNSSRPSTPNENLHPHWRQPFTPPHSPGQPSSSSSLHRIHQLEEEIHHLRGQSRHLVTENDILKEKLDNTKADLRQATEQLILQGEDIGLLREQLAEANKTRQEQETQINSDRSAIERLRERNAQHLLDSKRYNDAAEQFQLLVRLKDKERSLKIQQKDAGGQREAEEALWGYQLEYGKALVMTGQLDVAEREFVSVLAKRKERFGKKSARTRDVQTRLCDVFIRRGKTAEAMTMYHHAAVDLYHINGQNESDCTWTLLNALSLAKMLLENREYKKAVDWLKDVWFHRHKASGLHVSELETSVLACALTLVVGNQFSDASDLLTDLQRDNDSNGDGHAQNPSEDQISALLAHVHLMRGKFEAAESSAAAVYARRHVTSVFQSTASIDCSNFHHADTLIRARSKLDKKEKYLQAKEVWNKIYESRNEILAANKEQLRKHVAAALVLADEWENSCERRSTKRHQVHPTGARAVKREALEMREMLR